MKKVLLTTVLALTPALAACDGEPTGSPRFQPAERVSAAVSADPVDGRNYRDPATNTIYLSFAGQRRGYKDWETFLACNGTHPSRYEDAYNISALPIGGALPSVKGNNDRNEWMRGRRPVKSPTSGTIWVVVGCVKTGVPSQAAFNALFGTAGWNQIVTVPQAVLDSFPTSSVTAETPVRSAGTLIRGVSSGEVRWVTYHGGSLAISSPDVLSSHCRSFDEVLVLSDAEVARYPSKGVLRAGPYGCQSGTPTSDGFDYPVGVTAYSTQPWDGDGWYNAQDFRINNHLGEDWNVEGASADDCGKPAFAAGNGRILNFWINAPGWGNALLVRHQLPDGSAVETLYAHLQAFVRTSGEVRRGEQIGLVGNTGTETCHLHFEVRLPSSRAWGALGPGYSSDATGWTDPSNYLDSRRRL